MRSSTCQGQGLRAATLAASFLAAPIAFADAPRVEPGQKIELGVLRDAAGKTPVAGDANNRKATVVVFLSFDCPVSTGYSAELAELFRRHAPRGVAFAAVCPGDDDAERLARHAQEFALPFPVLADPRLTAADAFGARATPEAFVLDGDSVLRYRGRIDDGFTARLKKNARTTRHDLRQALDEVLAGKMVSEPVTEPVGCPIHRPRTTAVDQSVTFHRDVLPVLQRRCQECHRPNDVAPFSLLTYKQAVRWGTDIKEFTQSRRMPPWKPVESHGQFGNERDMPEAETALLARWVDAGMPEGDPKDAPPPRRFREGWQLGQPDVILEPPEDVVIGPDGRDLFRVLVFPSNFTEDRYLSAFEVLPGNKRVVHHTLNIIDTTGAARRVQEAEAKRARLPDERDEGPGYSALMGLGFLALPPRVLLLSGWAPGMQYQMLPDGMGYRVPKGSDFVVQIHYHRTGRVERDRTRVGLYFAKKPVKRSHTVTAIPGLFTMIPAGRERFKVGGGFWVNEDFDICSVMPHMHLLGREIKATLTFPDGTTKTLIWIKDWDFNWQEFYFLKEPIHVPAGSRFDVVAYYDNSAKNPSNPNSPPRMVFVGEQTTNEMCLVFLGCATEKGHEFIVPWLTPPRATASKAAR